MSVAVTENCSHTAAKQDPNWVVCVSPLDFVSLHLFARLPLSVVISDSRELGSVNAV